MQVRSVRAPIEHHTDAPCRMLPLPRPALSSTVRPQSGPTGTGCTQAESPTFCTGIGDAQADALLSPYGEVMARARHWT